MKILKYLTAGCTIISIISGVTSFIMGDTLNGLMQWLNNLKGVEFDPFNSNTIYIKICYKK
jgi:hypothetical protein